LIALTLGVFAGQGAGLRPSHVTAAGPIRVAVEQGPGTGASAVELAGQLNDDTFFDFTATIVTASQIDTLAELQNYDVVVFGDSGSSNPDWSVAMATALRDWAQNNGGGVVSTGWADFAIGSNGTLDPILDDIMPIDAYPNGNNEFCDPPGLGIQILTNSHPVTAGLSDFALPTSGDVEISPFAPDATNGQVLGTATATGGCTDSPTNTVVVGELGSGHLVYLGPVYLGSVGLYNNGDLRTGSPDRLLEQAVAWAALGSPDGDGDGVSDNSDSCPGTASGAEVDVNGCSAEQRDSDGDGVSDADDQCPDSLKGEDVNFRGCPVVERERRNVGGAIAGIFGNPNATPTKPAGTTAAAPATTGTLKPPSTGDGGLADENP